MNIISNSAVGLKDAVGRYIDLFQDFHNECQELTSAIPDVTGGAHCVADAGIKTIKTLVENSNKKSPECNLSSYVVVLLKNSVETDQLSVDRIVRLLEDRAATAISETVEPMAWSAGGCAVGGVIGIVGGGLIGLSGGPAGAGIGAALSFPVGCATGAAIGSDIYLVKNGIHKLEEAHDLYKRFVARASRTWGALEGHYRACHATPELNSRLQQTPIFWESAAPKSTTIKTYLGKKSSAATVYTYEKPHLFVKPPKFAVSSNSKSASTALVSLPSPQPPVANLPMQISQPLHPVEETALKLMDIAGCLTGITPALNQANDLKKLFITVMSDPSKAPDLLVKQLYKGPKEIFDNVVNAPKQMLGKLKAFNADPNLSSALGVAGAVFSIMSITIEVLPIIQNISREAAKNPLKLAVVIPKELLKLTFNKILAVHQLAKDFIRNPLEAAGNLVMGILKMPETFGRTIRDFFTGGRKAKKKRRQLEEAIRQQQEKLQQEAMAKISQIVGECFETAEKQWIKLPHMTISEYFTNLVNDWKSAVEKRIFNKDIIQYLTDIKKELEEGNFPQVYWLSPTAHTKELVAPPMLNHVFRELALSSIQLQVELVRFEAAMKADEAASAGVAVATQGLKEQNLQLGNFLETNKDALRLALQAMQQAYLNAKK